MVPKKKLLFEDITTMSDKWAIGNTRQLGPSPTTLVDILKSPTTTQHPNKVVAPAAQPYTMQNFVQLIGDLYMQASQIKKAVQLAGENPILDNRKAAKRHLAKIVTKISLIHKIINSISNDVDDFSIEKAEGRA